MKSKIFNGESDTEDSDTSTSDVSISSSSSEETEEPEQTVSANINDENITLNINEEEDETIKAFIREKNKKNNHPPSINFDDHIVDVCFHPNEDLLAVASITGDVFVCKYNDDETIIADTWELHLNSCRDIEFSTDGEVLISTAKDKSIMITNVQTGRLVRFYEECHEVPVYCLRVLDNNILASGDDDGRVKLWDLRSDSDKQIYTIKKHDDFISDMVTNEANKYLVCSSGDGSISSVDLRKRGFHLQSEEYDEEFTCMGLLRTESKLLANTSKGKMYLFNWEEFGYHSDEFPGLKYSINCIVPVTENIVVTASENGVLRATHLFPHKHLGIVGQHTMPIESIDISNNGHLIASSSHNNDVKFWNIQYFETFEKISSTSKRKTNLSNNLPSSKQTNVADFFADLN